MRKFWLICCFLFCAGLFAQQKTIETITISGVKKTKPIFIKKLIETKEGQVLDSVVLHQDLNLIKRLPAVANATYKVVEKQQKNYEVIFNIEENFTIIPDVAFWTAANNQFAYRLGIYDYNFLGKNVTVGGFYQNNGYDSYAFIFNAPNLFSRKLGGGINYQNWKSEEPLYFSNGTANYLYNNISTEFFGTYQANFKHKLTFGISFFKEVYTYLSGDKSPEAPLFLEENKKLYKLLYDYENIDYEYYYLDGFKSQLVLQMVTTRNDYQEPFFIAWNDFFYYKKIKGGGNWANRLRLGLSTNNESPFAPFALDNNINLRGVGILVDRGTGVIVYNTEYRQTFYDKGWLTVQGNAFIDAGSWRTPGGTFNDFTQKENVELFTGVGFRIMNKKIFNAVLRVDYGFSLKDNRKGLVFGIGQYF